MSTLIQFPHAIETDPAICRFRGAFYEAFIDARRVGETAVVFGLKIERNGEWFADAVLLVEGVEVMRCVAGAEISQRWLGAIEAAVDLELDALGFRR